MLLKVISYLNKNYSIICYDNNVKRNSLGNCKYKINDFKGFKIENLLNGGDKI